MLLPVCVLIGMAVRDGASRVGPSAPVLPWFAVVFAILVVVGSTGWLPRAAITAASTTSSWLLVTAMAAIGMKTSLRALLHIGPKAVMLVVGETIFLGLLVLAALRLF